jgi:hypothetical protein
MNEEEQLLLPLQINSGVVVVVPFFPPSCILHLHY